MYERVLFPTDGSEPAESVLEYALQIASEHEATLHVLNVADTNQNALDRLGSDVVDALVQAGETIVEEATQRAAERGVPAVSAVRRGDPHSAIIDYSEQEAVDCLVMPTHGRRGLQRFLLGSVTERVINTATVPVVAVNPERDRPLTYPPEHVLVPTDGSRGADLALTEGIAVATATGATLHLLHVVETGSLDSDTPDGIDSDRANEVIDDAAERAVDASLDPVTSVRVHREPSRVIHDYIDENGIDLAIVGTHGRTDFSRYVLGGVSAKLVRTSPVPVMWVREPDADEAPDY